MKYIKLFEAFDPKHKEEINIFDIDDSLVVTKAKIIIRDTVTGDVFELTPQQFNEYEHEKHHEQDYSQFDDPDILKGGNLIEWVFNILKSTLKKGKSVGIITARSDKDMIYDFLLHHGVDVKPDLIFAVSDPKFEGEGDIAEKKKIAIRKFVEMGYKKIKFFDDDEKNLSLAKEVEKEHPEVDIITKHVKNKWIPEVTESLDEDEIELDRELTDEQIRMWALYAHISDFLGKAKDRKELNSLYKTALMRSRKFPDGWPQKTIEYFYNWHIKEGVS